MPDKSTPHDTENINWSPLAFKSCVRLLFGILMTIILMVVNSLLVKFAPSVTAVLMIDIVLLLLNLSIVGSGFYLGVQSFQQHEGDTLKKYTGIIGNLFVVIVMIVFVFLLGRDLLNILG